MPVSQLQQAQLTELWDEALARTDRRDLRSTVRPSQLADPEERAGWERTSTRSATGNALPLPGAQSVGLDDLPGMGWGRERYFLGAMLGRGGMSVVLEAVQRTLGRSVAVKIARCDLNGPQRDRFRVEAKCTAWLEHPHIIPVYEAGQNYLVMRRIVGSNMEEELLAGRLDLESAVEVLLKVCDAVAFAHDRGIIHRDIKPENILVGRFGEVMLADWGLALTCTPPPDGEPRAPLIGSGRSLCGGTPGYMAPEIALADRSSIGCATDVFLLGATLYRCLSGNIPFAGEDVWQAIARSASNDWAPLGGTANILPRRLIALQEQAMASDPKDRPTVAEFQTGLRGWLLRSRAESEALRELAAAQRHLQAAQGHRLHPHEAYLDFSEAIAACDRAHALNPDLEEVGALRERACSDFTLAAVGAGEPQLARLIKRSGRLPVLVAPPAPGQTTASGQTGQTKDASAVRRIAKLLPNGGDRALAKLIQERQQWRTACDQLQDEAEVLRTEARRLSTERDTLAGRCAEGSCHLRHRRRLRLAIGLVTLLALSLAYLLLRG